MGAELYIRIRGEVNDFRLAGIVTGKHRAVTILSDSNRNAAVQVIDQQDARCALARFDNASNQSLTDNDDNQRRKRNAGVIAMSYDLSLRRGAFMDLGHGGYLRARAQGNVTLSVECWVRLRELPGAKDTVGIISALGGEGEPRELGV